MQKVVIIGGVAGGATAAARLRRLREDFKITILERGSYVSFANCGLPYFVGGIIKESNQLQLMSERTFLRRFNIEVKINHEVISIDRKEKKVEVRDIVKKTNFFLEYDYLILSPGASPIVPSFKGLKDVASFTLRTIPDSVQIIEFAEKNNVKHATVIGGGYIGLELAENLKKKGIKVKIIEMLDQVLTPLDKEIAQFVHQELILNGVCLQLNDAVDSFRCDENKYNYVISKSGNKTKTDMIILAIGVKPESKLAECAGLKIGPKGHIMVDDQMRTSDPSIFAVGDAVQVENLITHDPATIPLAGPANKQGRIAANNIAGKFSKYNGILGASVLKLFDITVSFVGLNEKILKNSNIKYDKIYVHPNNHASYYPGAVPITLKLIFEIPSGRILGAQAVGGLGTEKRIDVISTVIKFSGTVFDLEELELTYAPPYSSAKDPINMAGYVASNVLKGDHPIWHWDEFEKIKSDNSFFLDVRTSEEYKVGTIGNAVNISDLELRNRLEEVPRDKDIYIFCEVGFRGYLSTRLLMQKGYENVHNLSGGYKLFKIARATTEDIAAACGPSEDIIGELIEKKTKESSNFVEVDACGLVCPGPLNALIKSLETLPETKKLKIFATDPGFKASVEAYVKLNEAVKLLYLGKEQEKLVAVLEKGKLRVEDIEAPIKMKKKPRKTLKGLNTPPITEISVDELYERLGTENSPQLVVDVRTPEEFTEGHIKGIRSVPLSDLITNLDMLNDYKDEEIVLICAVGSRSLMAAQLLVRAGYTDLRNLTGGMSAWKRKGYRVIKGSA